MIEKIIIINHRPKIITCCSLCLQDGLWSCWLHARNYFCGGGEITSEGVNYSLTNNKSILLNTLKLDLNHKGNEKEGVFTGNVEYPSARPLSIRAEWNRPLDVGKAKWIATLMAPADSLNEISINFQTDLMGNGKWKWRK